MAYGRKYNIQFNLKADCVFLRIIFKTSNWIYKPRYINNISNIYLSRIEIKIKTDNIKEENKKYLSKKNMLANTSLLPDGKNVLSTQLYLK